MLKEGYFRVDFQAEQALAYKKAHKVKLSECYFLPYRTEETHMHQSSTVYKYALKNIKKDLGDYSIDIKHIYELTDYEDIN